MPTANFAINQPSFSSSNLNPESMATVFQLLTQLILGFDMTNLKPIDQAPNGAIAGWTAVRCAWQSEGQPAPERGPDTATIAAYPQGGPFSNMRDQLYAQPNPIAITIGTATSGSTQLTVGIVTNVVAGLVVTGQGIAAGTVVVSVSGAVVTLSLETIGALNQTLVSFADDSMLAQNSSYTQVWRVHWTFYGKNSWDHAQLIRSAIAQFEWTRDFLNSPPPSLNAVQPIKLVPPAAQPVYVPEVYQGQWWKRVDLDLTFNELVIQSTLTPIGISTEIIVTADTGATETVDVIA